MATLRNSRYHAVWGDSGWDSRAEIHPNCGSFAPILAHADRHFNMLTSATRSLYVCVVRAVAGT
jgi:hypothetical protein